MKLYGKNLEEQIKRTMDIENQILRRLLWLNHGHPLSSLYGDDGQMQCYQCMREYGFYDWKNTPAKEIEEKINETTSNR